MKKILPILLLGTALGFSVMTATSFSQVKAEEETNTSEVINDPNSEERNDVVNDLIAKYNEIKDKQVLNTTVGAIIGAGVSLILSLSFSLLNRSNINKSLSVVDRTRELKDSVEKNYSEVANVLKEQKFLTDVNKELQEKLYTCLEELEKSKEEHEKEIKLLLSIIYNDADLVKSGTAEKIANLYGNKEGE